MRHGLSPEELEAFLSQPTVATLATLRKDGSVLLSPVWYEWRDGGFSVGTGKGDVKARHLRRDPRASIVVHDDEPPYRGVEVRCEAKLLEEDARATARRIAVRYLGDERGAAYAEGAGDDLVIRLEPGELRGWDFADEFPEA